MSFSDPDERAAAAAATAGAAPAIAAPARPRRPRSARGWSAGIGPDARRPSGDRLRQLAPDRTSSDPSDDHALEQVLELAHVARPVVVREQPQRVGRQRDRRLVVVLRVLPQEALGQHAESRRAAGAAAAA